MPRDRKHRTQEPKRARTEEERAVLYYFRGWNAALDVAIQILQELIEIKEG